MNNPIDAWKVDAFVDGELDLAGQLDMEERLRDDAMLRREVDDVRSLREIVRDRADRHAAPESLRARMAGVLEAPAVVAATVPPAGSGSASASGSVPPSAATAALRRWFGWRPLVASTAFAAVLAVALNLAWLQSSRQEWLAEDVVASHVRSTLGQHLTDVASSDHHTVKPFLSSKLGFSPPVSELQLPGAAFLGGRVDYLDGRPAAALVYRQGEHIVNSFIWPGSAAASPPVFSALRGYRTAHWSQGGMNHWLVSDVNPGEFQAIVDALRRADATP